MASVVAITAASKKLNFQTYLSKIKYAPKQMAVVAKARRYIVDIEKAIIRIIVIANPRLARDAVIFKSLKKATFSLEIQK